MSEKFQNKYRIASARLQTWDYGWNAPYFVTICTKDREHYFGEILNGEMQLSEIGELANDFWLEIPAHFPFAELNAFVIMPNHIHGILVFDKRDNYYKTTTVETPKLGVSTTITDDKSGDKNEKWKPGILGVIINQYKRMVTIHARKLHADFAWQSRFHDHIISNEISFNRIADYIRNNVLNWKGDKFFS